MGVRETEGGDPEFSLEDPSQVTIRHPQPTGQPGEAQPIREAVFDQARSAVGKAGVCLDTRIARCELRPAPETWPETGRLGRSRAREKDTAPRPRRFYGADGPAVYAGRRNPCEKAAVKARVMGQEGLVAYVRIEFHGLNITFRKAGYSPFSDMTAKNLG